MLLQLSPRIHSVNICRGVNHLTALTFLRHADTCIFYKLRVCGNLASKESISMFPTVFAHSVSLWLILVICTLFQAFSLHYICYDDLWSVIFDVPVVIVWGHQDTHPYKRVNLIDNCCVCPDVFITDVFPSLSLSSGFPIPWDKQYRNQASSYPYNGLQVFKEKEGSRVCHFKSKARKDSSSWGRRDESQDRAKI